MERYQNVVPTYSDGMDVGSLELGNVTGSDTMCLNLIDVDDATLVPLVSKILTEST